MCRQLQFSNPLTGALFGGNSFRLSKLQEPPRWSRICIGNITRRCCGVGSRMEQTQNAAVAPKSRHSMLSLLVVLFLISYGLLTTLVVMQDRTIDSQRSLIHLLFKDNLHLGAMKAGLRRNQMTHAGQITAQGGMPVPTPLSQVPSSQTPSAQVPTTQTPSAQVPLIQAKPQPGAKPGRNSR